jgi:peptidoglycan hydrolase CwlO-like protein
MESLKNFIIKHYNAILITLSILLIGWFAFRVFSPNTMSEGDKSKIDSAKNIIEEKKKEQVIIEDKIEDINEEVETIDDNISKIKTNKEKIGKKYHEEITRVDNYTNPELDSFFSNRYK